MDILQEIAERARQWKDARERAVEALDAAGSRDLLDAAGGNGGGEAPVRFPLRAKAISELRVAAVLDPFSLDSYSPECRLLEVTPEGWREEIDGFRPDLLFVESAWQGKDGLWYRKIANGSKEYFAMTSYCRERGIPVVFWNKEDPIYTDVFMQAAAMADVVFTTDIDCVEKYRRVLGTSRVYHLHFSAQPKLHNPLEICRRQNKFCFAGAYYHRYPQRAKVFDAFAERFIQGEGLDIYDRNYQNARPEHAFPAKYDPYILGKLAPAEIDRAYKGYLYGVNMNSVNQSQTMFARRVFEMLASNTITVGNYARGQKNYFGDLTICTDDAETLERMLKEYCGDLAVAGKYRLLGLRKVLSEHLYEDRLDSIVQKVFGKSLKRTLPPVTVVASARSREEAERLLAFYRSQTYGRKSLVLFLEEAGELEEVPGVRVLPPEERERPLCDFVSEGFTALFDPDDWYGPNYLLDLVLTLRYGQYRVIGKDCYYTGEGPSLKEGARYQSASVLVARRCIAEISVSGGAAVRDYGEAVFSETEGMFSVDEFNYCESWSGQVCPAAADLAVADQGLPMEELEAFVEKSCTGGPADVGVLEFDKGQFLKIRVPENLPVAFQMDGAEVEITSGLPDGSHNNFYAPQQLPVGECASGRKLHVMFQGSGDLDVMGIVLLLDAGQKRLKAISVHRNRLQAEDVPEGTALVQVGLRVCGSGSCRLRRVAFGENCADSGAAFVSRSDILVLTNQYPSFGDLYRNAFVHKRVLAYRDAGVLVDVMRMNIYAKDGYREFEGINVIEGQARTLSGILERGRIKTVCVHFLDEQMWSVLKYHLGEIRLLVWVHGAEVQPWWRREYNYVTEKELEEGKAASEVRQAFWREVFEAADREASIHFIFVSQYFADEVMEDNHVALRPEQYSVIHNCIDTELFRYVPKTAELRKKVLSIKPYASRKYANDITMNAIAALSKESCFRDMEFTLYGSGARFQEDTAALKKFKNVHLHEQFLPQYRIAELHQAHGVLIATTRMDAQGVSRDEAMSSGLVPIASNVTAIPEFVDEDCGILVPGEDPQAVADALKRLYEDPELFLRLSEGAAGRVRRQTSREYTIDRELELICGEGRR